MGNELGEKGYDKESEYFFKKNKELIHKMRGSLDEQRAQQASHSGDNPHWMKCPKCGKELVEVDLSGVKVDQCTDCMGIFFDKGELELLLEAQGPKGFLGGIRKLFSK